jgi:hypothetical protein
MPGDVADHYSMDHPLSTENTMESENHNKQ